MAKKEPDKLARDAAAALRTGMSYGRWKAMQPRVSVEKQEIPDGWLVCEYCGKPFKPTMKRAQRFCEVGCQKQAYSKKRREKNAAYMAAYRARK